MLKQLVLLFSLLFVSCSDYCEGSNMQFLTAKDGYILDESGKKVTLKGMSSHGLAWYQNFYNFSTLKHLKDDWKISVFRIAMYTEEWGGYISNPGIKTKVNGIVDAAISLDLYVIIDWHILKDGNPRTHEKEAALFFDEMSKTWGGFPNVIFEICNEPNGYANWNNSIKPYAETIIPIIRKNAPKSLVIVGTGSWSQDILAPAQDPLSFENVAYALHFYAGTHGDWLRGRIGEVKKKGLTIFVSEWGMSQASGGGGVYPQQSKWWLDYLEQEKISWVNWSLAPKNESSAALRETASPNGGWRDTDLSESGRWVRNYLISHPEN